MNRSLLASLYQMASETQIAMGAEDAETVKIVETHVSQIVEAAVADFRLKQLLLLKNIKPKQDYQTRPAAADVSYSRKRKLLPQTIQKILHAHEALHLGPNELAERFHVSRTCIATILTRNAQAVHVKVQQQHGNRTRGAQPAFVLSGSQQRQS